MTDRELMQMALDAVEEMARHFSFSRLGESRLVDTKARGKAHQAIEALRARLAQPEPEPVAWWHDRGDFVDLNVSGHGTPLYFAPPQREFIGLTEEEIKQLWKDTPQLVGVYSYTDIAREVEAKLKAKNAL